MNLQIPLDINKSLTNFTVIGSQESQIVKCACVFLEITHKHQHNHIVHIVWLKYDRTSKIKIFSSHIGPCSQYVTHHRYLQIIRLD